jgi:hypothetical protein
VTAPTGQAQNARIRTAIALTEPAEAGTAAIRVIRRLELGTFNELAARHALTRPATDSRITVS